MFSAAGNKSTVRFFCFLVGAIFMLMIIQRGEARPFFPEREGARMVLSSTLEVDHSHQEGENLFSKYFNGVSIAPASSGANRGGVGDGFEDSMRRVPSCPDPLHN